VAAKRPTPIEVDAARGRPLGMAPARFLRDYWQKRPLLVRGAFPQFHKVISPDDLAGLACVEAALSRLVIRDARRDRWTVRSGPFTEGDFTKLPKSHWTLLVQDVDKWDADVATLLDAFVFLPSWRIDDVMISYATDGGGVGAHVDQYDVFLIQGIGQRRWRISTAPGVPLDFRDDVELKLLKQFTPTHEWTLQPGDALYLPPGVPHDGIAIGNCMTYSVGMRAPSVAELVIDLAESVAEPLGEERRYIDADLAPARAAGEIDAAAMHRVVRSLSALRDLDDAGLRSWFGRFITRYRSAHEAVAAPKPISAQQLANRLERSRIVRNPWSRIAWSKAGRGAEVFVGGEAHGCSTRFAKLLASHRELSGAEVHATARRGDLDTLTALINAGHFALAKGR
jgi:50S ribosomal protein L16 3-hydroxylase